MYKQKGDSNSGSSSDSYTDDDDWDDSNTSGAIAAPVHANNFNNFNPGGFLFGIGTPFFGTAALRWDFNLLTMFYLSLTLFIKS